LGEGGRGVVVVGLEEVVMVVVVVAAAGVLAQGGIALGLLVVTVRVEMILRMMRMDFA
jgi:hypothetical protein